MALPMEFWGVEVKAGQPLKVSPGDDRLLHLSQASLGESKNSKGDSVPLYVKFGDQKLVLGTLSTEDCPQISFDLVFEKEFELSHNWKNGSVFFCGYKSVVDGGEEYSDVGSEDDSEEEALALAAFENGKVAAKVPAKPATAGGNAAKAEASGKQKAGKAGNADLMKVDEDDSDDDEDDSDDDEDDEEGDSEFDSDDSDEEGDEEDEEETPKKVEQSKKRAADSAIKTPQSAKKPKLPSPQKTDGKKGGHTATPHPAKKGGNAPANNSAKKTQSPKSGGGQVSCKSCSKTFNSEVALQAHSKAKHGGS